MRPSAPVRRRLLKFGTAALCALPALALPRLGQAAPALSPTSASTPPGPRTEAGALAVTQLLDMSPAQQELSRDYSTGIRLAFAELRQNKEFAPALRTIETDGRAESVRQAIALVRDDASQVALVGAVGEDLALASLAESARSGLDLAHIAPWLADGQFDSDERLIALFASREEQVRVVLHNLATVGVAELAVVYPSLARQAALQAGTEATAQRLGLQQRSLTAPPGMPMAAFGAGLPRSLPAFVLFMGGSIELAQFTVGLAQAGLQRYVICLSDVDPATFGQLHPGKGVPVIFTQVVPNPRSGSVPVVRAYRAALERFFDEAPSPVSLAGYLAGRYTAAVLAPLGANASRTRVTAALRRRPAADLDGYRLAFSGASRASNFVAQTLLNARGVLVS